MSQERDYRKHAEECTVLAQTARTSAQRTMLLHIADTWMRLARDAEAHELLAGEIEIKQAPSRLM